MKSLIAILITLLVLSFAEAKTTARSSTRPASSKVAKAALNPLPQKQLNTLLTFSEFVKLSKENQEFYVMGLQRLMLDLQKQDDALKTQYQTAQHWLSVLIEDAVATDEDRPCVYAGWISSMDMNGKSCLRPKSDGCLRGKIQCNPMLYGAGRCVSANRGATASCERSKKTLSQIVGEIRGHEQEWSNMREELTNYCNDPRPTQGKVCAIIRNRLAKLERVIGNVPPPKFEAESAGEGRVRVSRAESSSDAEAEAVLVSPTRDDSSATEDAPRVSVGTPPSRTSPLSLTRSSGACNPATLLANLRAESSTTMASVNLMDLEAARKMMCSTDTLSSEWISRQRSLIAQAATQIRGNDKYARADRINYQGILNNFNACVKDATTLRSTGAGSVTGSFATVIQTGDFVKMYDESNRPIVGLGSKYDLEGLLRAKGISICNIRTQDDVQLAPVYSNSPSRSTAPSGATQ